MSSSQASSTTSDRVARIGRHLCPAAASSEGAASSEDAVTSSEALDFDQRLLDSGMILPPAPKPLGRYKPGGTYEARIY
jgi:hypothetical protein